MIRFCKGGSAGCHRFFRARIAALAPLALVAQHGPVWAQGPKPELQVYEGGRGASCYRPDDSFHRTNRLWSDHIPKGAFNFGAHGEPGKLMEVSYRKIRDRILPLMRKRGHVFLQVCDAGLAGGKGVPALARRVARDSGRPVVAAMGTIVGNAVLFEGQQHLVHVVARAEGEALDPLPEKDSWKVFYPDGRVRPLRADRYFREVIAPPGKPGALP